MFTIDPLTEVKEEYGEVIWALARCLWDRGYDSAVIQRAVAKHDMQDLWDIIGGPTVDQLERLLGLEPDNA